MFSLRCTVLSDCFETTENINSFQGLLDNPRHADGVNTFYFGFLPSINPLECQSKCADQEGFVVYTYFYTDYSGAPELPDPVWYGECVGRTNFTHVWEEDLSTHSGSWVVCSGAGMYSSHNYNFFSCCCNCKYKWNYNIDFSGWKTCCSHRANNFFPWPPPITQYVLYPCKKCWMAPQMMMLQSSLAAGLAITVVWEKVLSARNSQVAHSLLHPYQRQRRWLAIVRQTTLMWVSV